MSGKTGYTWTRISGTQFTEVLTKSVSSWQKSAGAPRDKRPARPTILVLGETGNAKTEIIGQVARAHNLDMIELGLGNALDPSEITGVRVPVQNKETGKWHLELAPLHEISQVVDTGKPFMLFIDEVGAEAPQMRNFLLKLLAEKNLNGVDVSNAYIVMAGNPPGGTNYGVRELEKALRARICLLYCELKPEEVCKYFEHLGNDVQQEYKDEYRAVAAFLRNNPKSFNGTDTNKADMIHPARCARAYHYAVDVIHDFKNEPQLLNVLLQGILGPATGNALADYVINATNFLYSPEDILAGKYGEVDNGAQWKENMEQLLSYVGQNNHNISARACNNIMGFIKFGKPDLLNGLFRDLSKNKFGLPKKAQTLLLSNMKRRGFGDTADTTTAETAKKAKGKKKEDEPEVREVENGD